MLIQQASCLHCGQKAKIHIQNGGGVTWNSWKTKCVNLNINSKDIRNLPNLDKLSNLQSLDCQGNYLKSINVIGLNSLIHLDCSINTITSLDVHALNNLQYLNCSYSMVSSLNLTGCNSLIYLNCSGNYLTSVSTLTSRGLITDYDFRYNNMPTSETNRIIGLNFDSNKVLPQNP